MGRPARPDRRGASGRCPRELEETAIELLLAPPEHDDEPRPTLQGHGDYVFGIFLLARSADEQNSVYYQEIGLVITHDTLLTVRKTPEGGASRTRSTRSARRSARPTPPG